MKLSKLNKIFLAVLLIITIVIIVDDRPRSYENKTQEQAKQECLNKKNFTPVVVWRTIRQGGSGSYSSDGSYSSRNSYGGGSSYGK